MKSAWVDSDAKAALDHWAKAGVSAELALRVYSTRLLGREPKLVLHGGGNTSVKTRINDLLGEEAEVLCVKGSGWDMASIEPAGMPAVRLEPLRKLLARDAVPDEEMVRVQRTGLIDPPGAKSIGRDAAARIRASQIRRSYSRHRGAEPDRSARQPGTM
jgi:rhamnose utilization protein RhaD (predicted bifunctional aldolase and dehydrogenase)